MASRRRIFGILSSLHSDEIPYLIAVLTLRLVRLTPLKPTTSNQGPLGPQRPHDSHGSQGPQGPQEPQEPQEPQGPQEPQKGPGLHESQGLQGPLASQWTVELFFKGLCGDGGPSGAICAVGGPQGEGPLGSLLGGPCAALEGLSKERALAVYINWFSRTAELMGKERNVVIDDKECGGVCATLADNLFKAEASTQLHGLLKTLLLLLQQQQQGVRPAAPFLVFLLGEVLKRLVPVGSGHREAQQLVKELGSVGEEGPQEEEEEGLNERGEDGTGDEETGEETAAQAAAAARGAGENAAAAAASRVRHKKHCLRIVLAGLQQLLSCFPELGSAWRLLLRPAAPALQVLLTAAVETGAAGRAFDAGGRDSCPAIVRLVASWAVHAVSK